LYTVGIMDGFRTRCPELWEDAPWSELGLPAAPPEVQDTSEDIEGVNEPKPESKKNIGWDGSGWS
jgi:hypothetical protein